MVDWLGGMNAGDPGDYAKDSQFQDRSKILGYIRNGITDATRRQAPQANLTALGGPAQVATGPQDQWRQMQMDQAQQLQRVATGQQQGAGELAALRAAQQAIAGQQAQAHMMRGGAAPGAALGAARNIMTIGGNVAGQAQQAALNDQQAANGQLLNSLNAGRGADIGLASTQAQLNQQTALTQGQMDQATKLANMDAQLRQTGMNDQARLAYLSQLTGMDAAQLQAQMMAYTAAKQSPGVLGSYLQAGGQIAGAAMMSDERVKTDITDGAKDIDNMLDALRPKTYSYKDPKHGVGPRTGIMAQDLERSEAGRRVVVEVADGKALDVNKALSAALAASARLNERVRALEGK